MFPHPIPIRLCILELSAFAEMHLLQTQWRRKRSLCSIRDSSCRNLSQSKVSYPDHNGSNFCCDCCLERSLNLLSHYSQPLFLHLKISIEQTIVCSCFTSFDLASHNNCNLHLGVFLNKFSQVVLPFIYILRLAFSLSKYQSYFVLKMGTFASSNSRF